MRARRFEKDIERTDSVNCATQQTWCLTRTHTHRQACRKAGAKTCPSQIVCRNIGSQQCFVVNGHGKDSLSYERDCNNVHAMESMRWNMPSSSLMMDVVWLTQVAANNTWRDVGRLCVDGFIGQGVCIAENKWTCWALAVLCVGVFAHVGFYVL
jgi:hypothetical protein